MEFVDPNKLSFSEEEITISEDEKCSTNEKSVNKTKSENPMIENASTSEEEIEISEEISEETENVKVEEKNVLESQFSNSVSKLTSTLKNEENNELAIIPMPESIASKMVPRLKFPFIISIECIPGANKEVFMNQCIIPILQEKCMTTIFVAEPAINTAEVLEKVKGEPKRWLFHYQIIALRDKFALYKNAFDLVRTTGDECLLLERSLAGDSIFVQTYGEMGNLQQIEIDDIQKWIDLCNDFFPIKPHLTFYLKTNMEIVANNLGESFRHDFSMNRKFLETLEMMHSVTFKLMKDEVTEVVTIRNMEYFESDEKIKKEIQEQVRNAILSHKRLVERV